MKKNFIAALATLSVMIIFCVPSVYALGFGAQARVWIPTFEGELRVDDGSVTGTEMDLQDDLGEVTDSELARAFGHTDGDDSANETHQAAEHWSALRAAGPWWVAPASA